MRVEWVCECWHRLPAPPPLRQRPSYSGHACLLISMHSLSAKATEHLPGASRINCGCYRCFQNKLWLLQFSRPGVGCSLCHCSWVWGLLFSFRYFKLQNTKLREMRVWKKGEPFFRRILPRTKFSGVRVKNAGSHNTPASYWLAPGSAHLTALPLGFSRMHVDSSLPCVSLQ